MESFLSLLFCKESEDEEIYTLVKDEGKSLSQFEWLSMYDEIDLCIELKSLDEFLFSAWINKLKNASAQMMNKYGDNRQTCLKSLSSLIKPLVHH